MDAIGSALSGMTSATQALDTAATSMARNGPDARSAVDMASAADAFKANAAVAKVADSMTGTLLDMLA